MHFTSILNEKTKTARETKSNISIINSSASEPIEFAYALSLSILIIELYALFFFLFLVLRSQKFIIYSFFVVGFLDLFIYFFIKKKEEEERENAKSVTQK